MGGFGSTRWKQHQVRPIAQQSVAFALNKQLRQLIRSAGGAAANRRSCQLAWYCDNQKIASCQAGIERAVNGDLIMRLDYCANGKTHNARIAVDFVPQPLGGHRAWWRCPQCRRRCGVLYLLHAASWHCRSCAGITYTTCNSSDQRITKLLRHDDLASALEALCEGATIGHLILQQKVTTIMRRRAYRDARRWFRRIYPRRHLPSTLCCGNDGGWEAPMHV
jgi:hypothetical protein